MPVTEPATYAPDASTARAKAESLNDVPNSRVHWAWPFASYFWRNTSLKPTFACPGSVPHVYPATYTPDAPVTIAVAASSLGVPTWRVHRRLPAVSYFWRYASRLPAFVWPGSAPSVWPATYTPDASTATAMAESSKTVPNWTVHVTIPSASYFPRNASRPPTLV